MSARSVIPVLASLVLLGLAACADQANRGANPAGGPRPEPPPQVYQDY